MPRQPRRRRKERKQGPMERLAEKKEKTTQPPSTTATTKTRKKTCTRRRYHTTPNPSKRRRRSNTHHSPTTTWCGCVCVDSRGGRPKYVSNAVRTTRSSKPYRRERRRNDTRNQPRTQPSEERGEEEKQTVKKTQRRRGSEAKLTDVKSHDATQVMDENQASTHLRKEKKSKDAQLVQFFGSNDFAWVHANGGNVRPFRSEDMDSTRRGKQGTELGESIRQATEWEKERMRDVRHQEPAKNKAKKKKKKKTSKKIEGGDGVEKESKDAILDPSQEEKGHASNGDSQEESPSSRQPANADHEGGKSANKSPTAPDPAKHPTDVPMPTHPRMDGSSPEGLGQKNTAEPDILTSEQLESEDEDNLKEEPKLQVKEEDAVSRKPTRGPQEEEEDTSPNGRGLDEDTDDQDEPSTSPQAKRRVLRPASKRKVPIKRYEEAEDASNTARERKAPVDPLELLGTVALETALQDMDEDEEAARTLSAVGGSGSQRKGGKKTTPSSKTEELAASRGKKSKICRSCGNKEVTRWWSQDPSLCSACGRLFSQGSYCPICERVYRARDNIPMIQCDKCAKWIHAECEGMSQEEYLNMADDVEYYCPICRGEPPVSTKKEEPKEEPQPAPPPKKQKKAPKAPSPPPSKELPMETPKEKTPPAEQEPHDRSQEGVTQWPPMFPPGGMPPMMHPAMLPFLAPQRVILPPSMLASVPKVIRLSVMQGRQNFANMWAMANQYLAHMSSASGSQGKGGQSAPQGMNFPQIPGMPNLGNPSQPGQQEPYFGVPFQMPGGSQEGKHHPSKTPEPGIETKPAKPLAPPKPKKTPKAGTGSSKGILPSNLLPKKKHASSIVGNIANQGMKSERGSGAVPGQLTKKSPATLVGKVSATASQASSVPFPGGLKATQPLPSKGTSQGGRMQGSSGQLVANKSLPFRPQEVPTPLVPSGPTSTSGPGSASAPPLVSSLARPTEVGMSMAPALGAAAPVVSSKSSDRSSPAPAHSGPMDGPDPSAGRQ
mmetsp:Transcript_10172/g.61984  ORF Transcript_10172/g.61984 Transcript_10172/m.61984 type:complete len:1001 (+) Transcript_10172:244-3246(+)